MTGFGTASAPWSTPQEGPATVEVELRSVNARFLELKVRQPFGASTEQQLRKRLGKRLGRGRVDLSVVVRGGESGAASDASAEDPFAALGIDAVQVDDALRAVSAVAKRADGSLDVAPVNPTELLRLLTATSRPSAPTRAASAPVFLGDLVDEAVEALLAFRSEEGRALSAAIAKLGDDLEAQVSALNATLPPEGERLAARIQERIAELTARLSGDGALAAALDADRVAQEVAVVIARGDVTEELDRIASHLSQLRAVLAGDAASGQGKTLEFVAQELFREITTIGSKITSHDGSRIVIEAKGTVERIREQVHNVE